MWPLKKFVHSTGVKPFRISESRLLYFLLNTIFAPALLVVECGAAELTITNRSFENPALSDGVYVGSVPGWSSEGTVGVQNLVDSEFTGTSVGSHGNPIDGLNAASVNGVGKLIYQDASWGIQPNVIYSLTFLAGYRIGGNTFGNSSVSFWAGTNLLSAKFPTPAQNSFVAYSLNYTSPPSGSVIGLPLRIELKAPDLGSQPWFDNFHLFANALVCTPHKATATAQLVNGIFVGVIITDSGCGYTNVPTVVIQGGGGNGAVATALVTNGQVVALQVNNGGCCYTNLPTVVIGSPPFVPTVEIRLSKVAVKQHVVLGRHYVLESSPDLVAWTPTGPSFTAVTESFESEFDLDLTGRYFRLREVP